MIKPRKGMVLVSPVAEESTTLSGIIYTDTISKNTFYKVERVGEEVIDVRVSDIVLLPKMVPTFTYNDSEYYLINPKHILAIKV